MKYIHFLINNNESTNSLLSLLNDLIAYYNHHQSILLPFIAGFLISRLVKSYLYLIIILPIIYFIFAHVISWDHLNIPNIINDISTNVTINTSILSIHS